MSESLAVRIASVPVTTVTGTWLRHAVAAYPERALDGRRGYGRWGTKTGFPVLYLGKPEDSVIVEAYRHLVDPVEDPALRGEIRPRILVTAVVAVTDVLDLSSAGARLTAGLTLSDLQSDTDDEEAYARCQEVAQGAHQLGRRGVLAPAATGLGQTLALFTDLTDAARQKPQRGGSDILWATLPPDPRVGRNRSRFLVVRNQDD